MKNRESCSNALYGLESNHLPKSLSVKLIGFSKNFVESNKKIPITDILLVQWSIKKRRRKMLSIKPKPSTGKTSKKRHDTRATAKLAK